MPSGLSTTTRPGATEGFTAQKLKRRAERPNDDAVAAQRGTAYAGEPDPYKKPREIVEDDDLDEDDDVTPDESDRL